MEKPQLNTVSMAMGLDACCDGRSPGGVPSAVELFVFGETAVDYFVKLDLDTVHTRPVPSISSKLGHFFRVKVGGFTNFTLDSTGMGTSGQTRLYFLISDSWPLFFA